MALTPGKARKILEDGTVHGRGLTDKQKKYFGAIAGGATPMKAINGGWLDKYNKAQRGNEVAIDNTRVNIPTIERFDSPKFPFTEGLQQLDEVVVTAPRRRQPMFSQDNRTSEQIRRDREDYNEENLKQLPLTAAPLTYLANPFRLIGDIYNATIQPAATSMFSTSTLQPLTGDFWTSDEVAREYNLRNIQRQRGQISPGEQMYGNLMQGLPETGWAAANVFGGQLMKGGLKYGKQFLNKIIPSKNTLQNIYKYYKNPLGDAFKIGNDNPKIPTFLTRGQNPPNPLRGNPRPDADNFMQSWTNPNNPSFVGKFDDQIMKGFPNASMNENYLRVKTRELNVLQQQLDDFVEATGSNVLPKAKSLQKSIDALTTEINMFYRPVRGNLARNNMKSIQAGEFNTVYSTTGYTPGSGGTYFIPTAEQPMNTWKYMYPNKPNTMGVGNNSVVKLREVPVGATVDDVTKARTSEMLTGIHETLGHASNAGGTALTKQTNDLIKSALKPNLKIKEGTSKWVTDFLGPKATYKDWAEYLQDPTEMIARVMELRRQYINPKYWGTGKQYDIPDKLIDRIFRDGLSGKAKVNADFFRVVDKKGLKKLMKGLYATVPMAMGVDGLLEYETPKYKDGGRCWPGYKAVAGKTPFSKGSCQKAEDGGWLDKFQEGGVIEDNRGQWAHPGKITKINSNNITMKGVNYPVLGVSDTGDTKMMQPGVDNYKYDGNSVTEYPMAQTGDKLEPLYKPAVPGYDQKEFLRKWTNSPVGQDMLLKSLDGNEKALEKLTKKRTGNLDMVSINMGEDLKSLGRYKPNDHSIKLNPNTTGFQQVGDDYKSVLLHELSHSQDYTPGSQFNKSTIPLSDQKLIRNLSKDSIKNAEDRKTKKENRYLADPTETRARLNVVRDTYEKFKDNDMPSVFDSEFTPSMLEEVKGTSQFEELQQIYTDDEIIQLLNTVSDNTKSSGPSNMAYAQDGGGLNKEGVNQYQFLKSYMNSQKYQDRLKKELPDYTEKQIAEEAKTRLNNVMQTRVSFLPESSDYSTSKQDVQGVYNRFGNKNIQFRPEYSALTPENPLFGYNTTPIHEFAHAADEGGDRIPQSTKDLMFRNTKDNSLGLPKQDYYYTNPTEVLGRMQEFRYLLNDQGIYDARKGEFTQEDLDKARKNDRIKYNARFQDLQDNVESDEALIELMNSIAAVNQDNKQQTRTAKQGRSLVSLDQLTNFTNYNTPQPGGWLDKY